MKICQRCNSRLNIYQKMALKDYNDQLGEKILNQNKFINLIFQKKNLDIDLKYFVSLTKFEFLEIRKILSKYPCYSSLRLNNSLRQNNRTSEILENTLEIFSNNLSNFTDCKIIELRNLTITTNKSIKILYNIFKKNKGFEQVSIISCYFDFNTLSKKWSFYTLIQGLYSHSTLENLNLINNNIPDDYNSIIICNFVENQNYKFKTRNWKKTLHNDYTLNNLPLKYNLGAISSIILSHNNLGIKFAENIIPILENDVYLRELDISYNLFDYKSCKLFSKLLKINKTLLNLDLRYNPGYDININMKIIYRLGNNLKYLKEQYLEGEFDRPTYKELIRNYINSELFTIESDLNDNIYVENNPFSNQRSLKCNVSSSNIFTFQNSSSKLNGINNEKNRDLENENIYLRNEIERLKTENNFLLSQNKLYKNLIPNEEIEIEKKDNEIKKEATQLINDISNIVNNYEKGKRSKSSNNKIYKSSPFEN